MGTSKIEWTEQTWNPTAGCTRASPECDFCYAVTMTRRLAAMGQGDYAGLVTDKHFNGKLKTLEHRLSIPLNRKKPTVYFVNSMSDLFHKDVPFAFVDKVFAAMALCPQHTFQILTKRPERMAEYTRSRYRAGAIQDACRLHFDRMMFDAEHPMEYPLPNVWLGVSVGAQATADARREHFAAVVAKVKIVSYEPAIGPVDWSGWEFVHQIISGGESGPKARPSHPDWHRNTRDFCQANRIAYFFKQWGEWEPWEGAGAPIRGDRESRRINDVGSDITSVPELWCGDEKITDCYVTRVGKKAAGRLLDGREWNEFPAVNQEAATN